MVECQDAIMPSIDEFPFQPFHLDILKEIEQKSYIIRNSKTCEYFKATRTSLYQYMYDLYMLGLIKKTSLKVKRGRPNTIWILNPYVYRRYKDKLRVKILQPNYHIYSNPQKNKGKIT